VGVTVGMGDATANDDVGAGEAVGAATEADGGTGIELTVALGPQLAMSAPTRPRARHAVSLARPARCLRGDGSIVDLVGRFDPDWRRSLVVSPVRRVGCPNVSLSPNQA